nr:hypothetical protein [Tanacetum cinerariifolium]
MLPLVDECAKGNTNPIRTLGDYSKPSHEGYMNTIQLLVGKNVDLSPHGRILLLVSVGNKCSKVFPLLVIEFGDSYKAPPEETAKDKGPAGEVSSSTKKKGRTVAITTEDMQKRKMISGKSKVSTVQGASTASAHVPTTSTDVAAASLSYNTVCAFIATQPNGSQIKYKDISQIDDDDIEKMDIKWNLALLNMRADRFWKKTDHQEVKTERRERERERESYKKDPKVEGPAPKVMIAIDGIGVIWPRKMKLQRIMLLCPMKKKKNIENLNTKISKLNKELSDCETDLYNYKRGLSQVEARLVEFKENEIKYCEKIRVLERDIELKDNNFEYLRNELEEVKKEKERTDFKIKDFKNALKDLDRLLGSQKLDKHMKGVGFNEYYAVPPPPAQVYSPHKKELSWMGLPEFVDDTITDYTRPTPIIDVSKSITKEQEERWKSNHPSFFEQGGSSGNVVPKPMIKFLKESGCPNATKVNNTENARKPTVKYAEMYRNTSQSPRVRGNQRNWNNKKSQQLGKDFIMQNKACYNCGSFDHLEFNCNHDTWVDKGKTWTRVNHAQDNMKYTSTHKSMTPRAVLLKFGTKPINRPFSTARPTLKSAQPKMKSFVKTTHSNVKWPFERKLTAKNKVWSPTVRPKIPTVGSKVHTAKPLVVADKGNKGKAHDWQHILPFEYEPFNGGYVSFGHGRGNITGKGSIKTDFKLVDDKHVLVRTPRQQNMYTIDLKNVVPHKNLTCLIPKASVDESMLWYRRLGHLNFKTMNKLVRSNLVIGLPSKSFKNDHSYVACLKGNHHKASCKSKLVNYVSKPLHTLHMDLFEPTSVSSLNHKWYCLVVTDDFSRKGIKREFSNARTPQQNGVAERRNMTLIEAARTIGNFVPTDSLSVPPITSSVPRIISKGGSSFLEPLSLGNVMSFTNRLEDFFRDTCNTFSLHEVEADLSNMETAIQVSPTHTLRIHKDYPKSQIIGPIDTPIQTRQKTKDVDEQSFIATIHQKTNHDLLQYCLFSCFLLQEEAKKIVYALKDLSWVEAMQLEILQFKIQNVWVLVDCLNREEGIDYEEVFARVVRIEAIRLFLAYGSYMGFTVYQMDVKSAFLYGTIDEEGNDGTGKDVELYLYRSMIGSLMYLTASRPDIIFAVCACARHQATPKDCHLHVVKRIFRYLKGNPKLGLWYPKEYPFDLVAYSDSDYSGANQDRKSATGGCQFLGRRLISWQCKKQTIVATSTTEA